MSQQVVANTLELHTFPPRILLIQLHQHPAFVDMNRDS